MPARPNSSTHRNLLAYCKELNVELEVFINENKTSLVQDDDMLGGRPIRNIDYTTNMRGFMAELMAKAMSSDELNAPFTESRQKRSQHVRSFGDLNGKIFTRAAIERATPGRFKTRRTERHDCLSRFT